MDVNSPCACWYCVRRRAVGERIKWARLARGLSQRRLAALVGLSAMSISKYETGKVLPNSGRLLQLAPALGVKHEYFYRQNTVTLTGHHYA